VTTGNLFGQTCYPSAFEAASAACSAAQGVGSDGAVTTCVGVNTYPGGYYTLQMRKSPPGVAATTWEASTVSQPCERYDYAYWQPMFAAFTSALVAVVAARVLYTRVFSRETL